MADKILSFEPSTNVINLVMELMQDLAKASILVKTFSKEEKDFINHCAIISNVGASTRIENATLTDYEIEWIDSTLSEDDKTTAFEQHKKAIINKLSKDKERSIEEVAGCRDMLLFMYANFKELFPLHETTIREFHKELLKYYPKASRYLGRYKQVTNRVVSRNQTTGEEKIILEPAAPGPINESAMAELVDWYNSAIKEYKWSVLVSIEFVFRFLAIHPFQDGNGRTGRALFLLSLLQSQDSYIRTALPFMAVDRHIEKKRPLYYAALKKCSNGKFLADSRNYNYEPIVIFLLKTLIDSVGDIEIFHNKFLALKNLSEVQLTIYECFKSFPEKRLSSSIIHKETGISLRTIQRELLKLCNKGFLHKRGAQRSTVYQLIF